jgi:hypothetical protein
VRLWLFKHPVDPWHVPHGLSFIYVILDKAAQRDKVQQLVLDRISTIRPQLPRMPTSARPNASSMGWIYQYALIDRNGNTTCANSPARTKARSSPRLQTVRESPRSRRSAVSKSSIRSRSSRRYSRMPAFLCADHLRAQECVSGNRRTHDRSHES